MNIAVLIGVSLYKVAAPLPACAADAEQMRQLLSATKKYDDICCLTQNTNASPLKDALRAFFAKYQNIPNIDEVLIYFSGHGVYHHDALLCCSDFDTNRPSTTSISNGEIDDLLRSISPNVAVKVIDACQSGSPYIKEASTGFEKALRTSRLNSFICMASSRLDQSSYATAEESAFTAKWIDAALNKQEGAVLYRDIQAALADAFVDTPEQTPFFVNQGTGLECFAVVTDEMRRLVTERDKGFAVSTTEDSVENLLAEEIARLDAQYISSEEASDSIKRAGDELDLERIQEPLVSRFYNKTVSRDKKLIGLPRARSVAEFADEQKWPKNYFVKVLQEEYRVRVPKNILYEKIYLSSLLPSAGDKEDYTIETRLRPSGLASTQALPFEVAEVTFEAVSHPSLKAFVLYIGFVHSLTEVMVLSAVIRLVQKGWHERSPELSDVQWKYHNYLWKDVSQRPRLLWEEALRNGESTIETYLQGLLPKKESLTHDETDVEPGTKIEVAESKEQV